MSLVPGLQLFFITERGRYRNGGECGLQTHAALQSLHADCRDCCGYPASNCMARRVTFSVFSRSPELVRCPRRYNGAPGKASCSRNLLGRQRRACVEGNFLVDLRPASVLGAASSAATRRGEVVHFTL